MFSKSPQQKQRRLLKLAGIFLALGLLSTAFQNCGVMVQDKSIEYIYPSTSGSKNSDQSSPGGPVQEAPPVVRPPVTSTNNPAYLGVQAISYSNQSGVQTEAGQFLSYIDDGDWVQFSNVDFESGARSIYLELALDKTGSGGTIEVLIDSLSGPMIAQDTVGLTAGWDKFNFQVLEISQVTGVHSLFIRFKGGTGVANFKSWALAK